MPRPDDASEVLFAGLCRRMFWPVSPTEEAAGLDAALQRTLAPILLIVQRRNVVEQDPDLWMAPAESMLLDPERSFVLLLRELRVVPLVEGGAILQDDRDFIVVGAVQTLHLRQDPGEHLARFRSASLGREHRTEQTFVGHIFRSGRMRTGSERERLADVRLGSSIVASCVREACEVVTQDGKKVGPCHRERVQRGLHVLVTDRRLVVAAGSLEDDAETIQDRKPLRIGRACVSRERERNRQHALGLAEPAEVLVRARQAHEATDRSAPSLAAAIRRAFRDREPHTHGLGQLPMRGFMSANMPSGFGDQIQACSTQS